MSNAEYLGRGIDDDTLIGNPIRSRLLILLLGGLLGMAFMFLMMSANINKRVAKEKVTQPTALEIQTHRSLSSRYSVETIAIKGVEHLVWYDTETQMQCLAKKETMDWACQSSR